MRLNRFGVLVLAGGILAGGGVMAQDERQMVCKVKAGEGMKVFDKCKAGDVLEFTDFGSIVIPRVCDFSKTIEFTKDTFQSPLFCVYIGYVRQAK